MSSEYHHVKGRKGTAGAKMQPLINVCWEVTVNFRSQSQEGSADQEDRLGDVMFTK